MEALEYRHVVQVKIPAVRDNRELIDCYCIDDTHFVKNKPSCFSEVTLSLKNSRAVGLHKPYISRVSVT